MMGSEGKGQGYCRAAVKDFILIHHPLLASSTSYLWSCRILGLSKLGIAFQSRIQFFPGLQSDFMLAAWFIHQGASCPKAQAEIIEAAPRCKREALQIYRYNEIGWTCFHQCPRYKRCSSDSLERLASAPHLIRGVSGPTFPVQGAPFFFSMHHSN